MTRKLLWLSLPVLFGLLVAALAVAAPALAASAHAVSAHADSAQAALTQQGSQPGPDTTNYELPPGSDVYGVVDSFPHALVGSWTVDNVVYTATRDTRFRMFAGPFYNGVCVHVHFDPNGNVASLIETVFHYKCSAEANQYLIGLIDQVPAGYTSTITETSGVTATWVISGIQFESTPATEFDTEHGPLAVGTCASVKYRQVNGVNVAGKISSEWMYRCLGPVAFNQAFGDVVSFPPDFNGAWVISDTAGMSLTFMTTPTSTLVVDNDHPIDVGTCVNVKYYTSQGINNAVLVVPLDQHACQGRFTNQQPRSKIYATIDTMPTPTGTLTGTWTLAGVNFTATQTTRFEQEDGQLAVGNCANGNFNPTNGSMLLRELESEEPQDCQARDGSQSFKLFGSVEMMPTGSFTGTWQVSGVTFMVTPSTTVQMDHGQLAIGAYVKVNFTYDANTGERTAQSISTHVAPGFGWINFHGHWGGWIRNPSGDQVIVDGKTYTADPDISAPASLQNGTQVWVNAYQDASGTTYVTQVAASQQIFMPLLQGQY
jgi:Domain of unknown function (DUF5666)